MTEHPKRIRKLMRAGELPPGLREALAMPPDTPVEVTVEVADDHPRRKLLDIMDRMGAQAEASGLTQEMLDEIVDGR